MSTAEVQHPISSQLEDIKQRKQVLKESVAHAKEVLAQHQEATDKAENTLIEAVTNNMAHPSPANEKKEKDARASMQRVVKQLKQAEADLEMVPTALKKLDAKEKALKARRTEVIDGMINGKVRQKIPKLEDKAMKAVAELCAYTCMGGSRDIHNSTPENIINKFGSDRDLIATMHSYFHKLEEELGVHEL
jgi:hypothetical protein